MADVPNLIDRDELVKHLDGVRRLARSLVGSEAEADDVMQDAAVAALETQRPVRKGLGAWLSGVTRNVVRNRRRGEQRRVAREAKAALPEAIPSAAESVVRAAEQSRLLELVVNMDEPYRSAVLLRFVDGLPPREIAARLDTPVETVRTHIKRGLARLRTELDRRHGGRDMWRATVLLVADGAPYARVAPGGASAGKKAVAGLLLATAVGLAAWWIWGLVQEPSVPEQPGIDLAGTGQLARPAGDESAGKPAPLVVKDEGPARPPLEPGRGEPPSKVQEPETRVSSDPAPVEPVPVRVAPTEPDQPEPAAPELEPLRVGSGRTGRLIADQTGGRVDVPANRVWIGTPPRWVDGITKSLRDKVPEAFAFEAPRHQRDVRAFAIDIYEVTNAQYQRYLHLEAELRFRVAREIGGTLEQIAKAVVTRNVPSNIDWDRAAQQLYRSNFDVLHDRHRHVVVRGAGGLVDVERTWKRLRKIEIRSGTELRFYDRAPPAHWPSMTYPRGLAAHPVRGVSMEEAEAFAHWAGKHIPTEFEWEYACRGANGGAYPWGGKPTGWAARVNGGLPIARGEVPRTAEFHSMPRGRSWLGLFHTLGNVSEWTSSFLEPYPGSDAQHKLAGYAMVIRGGSVADPDAVYVRPAYRGWRANTEDEEDDITIALGPLPSRRFPWTGFRCAVYPEPARSRLPEMQRRMQTARVLPASALDVDGYAGAEVKELIAPGTTTENGIFVNKKAWSFVAAPLKRIAVPNKVAGTRYSIDAPHGIEDTPSLLKAAREGRPLLLGQVRADTELRGLHATRNRGVLELPERLYGTTAPAGIYYVSLLHGRLALLPPDLSAAFYVTHRPITRATASIVRRSAPRRGEPRGRAKQVLDVTRARLTIDLEVPLGQGKRADRIVRVRFRYAADPAVVRNVGPWQTHAGR